MSDYEEEVDTGVEEGAEDDEFEAEIAEVDRKADKAGEKGLALLAEAMAGGAGGGDDDDDEEDEDDMFATEDVDDKGVGAIKAFRGAIIGPPDASSFPKHVMPEEALELEHVAGYRCKDTRANLHTLATGEVVYAAAALGVITDPAGDGTEQRFLTGHADDVLAVTVDATGTRIATGEIGARPAIRVWDAASGSCEAVIMGDHRRAIVSLAFSPDGTQLASIGNDDRHKLMVHEWAEPAAEGAARRKTQAGKAAPANKGAPALMTAETDTNRVLSVGWNPYDGNDIGIVTGGLKHLKFWGTRGGKWVGRSAVFGDARASIVSMAFTPDHLWAGSTTGILYAFGGAGGSPAMAVEAHKGAIYALGLSPDGDMVASGGRDGQLAVWNASTGKELTRGRVTTPAANKHPGGVAAICWSGSDVVAGTKRGEVLVVASPASSAAGRMEARALVESHFDGEVWGLASNPTGTHVVTSGDDNTVRVWEVPSFACVASRHISKKAVAGRVRGASSMSSYAPNQSSRAADWSPDGSAIAIGLNDGGFEVLEAAELSLTTLAKKKDRRYWVQAIKFSPDGTKLAVGSHDNTIDIYRTSDYKKTATCSGHTSFVSHLDWDASSRIIHSTCGGYELLFWDAASGRQLTSGARETRSTEWATWTLHLGWPVQGIWQNASGFEGADLTDIDGVDRSPNGRLLVTGDDYGCVNLFAYPAHTKPNAPCKVHRGHASHVTCVRWTADGSRVVSVGGNDCAVISWKLVGGSAGAGAAAASAGARGGAGGIRGTASRAVSSGTAPPPPPPAPPAGEWKEATDPSSGRKYLFNTVTRETKWA